MLFSYDSFVLSLIPFHIISKELLKQIKFLELILSVWFPNTEICVKVSFAFGLFKPKCINKLIQLKLNASINLYLTGIIIIANDLHFIILQIMVTK